MQRAVVSKEVRKRMDKVVNHVLRDLQGDLSLEALAQIASYSPYHFQKLFKQAMGESPKQFVARTRLETAAHFLIIQPNKPVQAVALDGGFSSPAVFARAFKNHFGVSAEEFRLRHKTRRMNIRNKPNHLRRLLGNVHRQKSTRKTGNFNIDVKTMPVQYGICLNTSFDSPGSVQKTLKELVVLFKAHDLFLPGTPVMGIIYPHHNIYRAFIPVDKTLKVPSGMNRAEIRAGKFAVLKVAGDIRQIFEKLEHFYRNWLPDNGYKLADIYGFEIFLENPVGKPYNKTRREIYIPIEPAG